MNIKEIVIPEISDEVLQERMNQVRFTMRCMSGTDGKPHATNETDKKYFDLFYVESSVDSRTESFNFDENRKITEKVANLKILSIDDVFIKVGGYYGFLKMKMTMAEVLSQIPEKVVSNVVAFGINPDKEPQVVAGGEYQIASIIFYGKSDKESGSENLPAFDGLIKPINKEKVERLKDKIKPIIHYINEGFSLIDPGKTDQPFMDIGIWMRINGSNLHRNNPTERISTTPVVQKEKISVYQEFTNGADYFYPTYEQTISQIPDKLINEKTIGFLYGKTDYFKTDKGVVHETTYTLIERV